MLALPNKIAACLNVPASTSLEKKAVFAKIEERMAGIRLTVGFRTPDTPALLVLFIHSLTTFLNALHQFRNRDAESVRQGFDHRKANSLLAVFKV